MIILLVVSTGCIGGPDKEARSILNSYNLHPAKIPAYSTLKIPNDKHLFPILNMATMDLGYNLEPYKGKTVNSITYLLKEHSQSQEGKVFAYFLYEGNKIIGAFMSLEGYMPGVVSLNYKRQIAPKNLRPYSLVFEDVDEIDFIGPWQNYVINDDPWTKTVKITDIKEINKFIKMLSNSTILEHEYKFTEKDKEYGFILKYKNGSEVMGRLYITDTTTNLILNNFYYWHYTPPKELIKYILEKLK